MAGFNRPKPVALDPAKLAALVAEASEQKIGGSFQKSTDPDFPYWNHEPAKPCLVYVPRIMAIDSENNAVLDIDKPLIHSINFNGQYSKIRCTRGLNLTDGEGKHYADDHGNALFDGSCPICDNVSAGFELAKLHVEAECKAVGLNPEDKDNDQVKAIRKKHYGSRALGQPDVKLTIPLVVFETTEDDKGRAQLVVNDNKPIYKIFWYAISQRQYEKTWEVALDNSESGAENIGGNVFGVQFGKKDAATGALPNARDAVKDLSVSIRDAITGKLRGAGILDEIDADVKEKGWTKSKAAEVLAENVFVSVPEIASSISTITADIAMKTQMMSVAPGSGGSTSLDALTGGGGAAAASAAPLGALPAGATDVDEPASGGLLGSAV